MDIKSIARRMTIYNLKKGYHYLKRYGMKSFLIRVSERLSDSPVEYKKWLCTQQLSSGEKEQQRNRRWKRNVKISVIVPVYCTPETFLCQMMESVQAQTYENWELCLADGSGKNQTAERVIRRYAKYDDRIHYQRLEGNFGISENTNAAIAMATGQYLAFFDHDDLLTEDALYEVASAIENEPDTDMIYTDEDKVSADLKEYFQPHFKPDYNIELLRTNNYFCHLLVIRRKLVLSVGGEDSEFDGAQDYDLIFRCAEQAHKIVHIPKVLYHWRIHKKSTADNPNGKDYALEAGKKAIEAHLKRCQLNAEVEMLPYRGFYRVKYKVTGQPLVSIIIPNKDEIHTLQRCLESIRNNSVYLNYEIIIVENNSTQEETFEYYDSLKNNDKIRVVFWPREFNYSAINNFGVSYAKGEYLVLLNNDVTVVTPDWMEQLLGQCQKPDVGVAGVRLYFPDHTIQHAGIVIGIGESAGNMFVGVKQERSGYMHKIVLQQNLSAVTAACMMVKKTLYNQIGGFDELLAVAFNDVDFCLRAREAGYMIVYEPNVEMYHYESKSRGYEDTEEKKERFNREKEFFRKRWEKYYISGDPFYNRNLSLKSCDYSIRRKKR